MMITPNTLAVITSRMRSKTSFACARSHRQDVDDRLAHRRRVAEQIEA
jgi:hypothetical protein